MTDTISRETHELIEELLEDTMSFACDEFDVSSNIMYKITEVFAMKMQYKLESLQNSLTLSQE